MNIKHCTYSRHRAAFETNICFEQDRYEGSGYFVVKTAMPQPFLFKKLPKDCKAERKLPFGSGLKQSKNYEIDSSSRDSLKSIDYYWPVARSL